MGICLWKIDLICHSGKISKVGTGSAMEFSKNTRFQSIAV